MNYGKRMNEIRNYLELSQKDVAKVLNISPYTYSHYETQDSLIPLKHLIKFCNYFKVSIDYIFGLSNEWRNTMVVDANLKQIGNNIKMVRKLFKITQEKLARDINVARTILSEYENGNFLISIHALFAIAKKYNISADYILGRKKDIKITSKMDVNS